MFVIFASTEGARCAMTNSAIQ